MIFTALTLLIGTLSVVALGWCFAGFFTAMKEPPRFIGLMVHSRDVIKMLTRRGNILEFPPPPHPAPGSKEPPENIRASG